MYNLKQKQITKVKIKYKQVPYIKKQVLSMTFTDRIRTQGDGNKFGFTVCPKFFI